MFIAAGRAARRTVCLAALSVAVLSASAGAPPPSPPRLAAGWPAATLRQVLVARSAWHPIPTIGDRAAWQALPDALKRRIRAGGDQALAARIPELPATWFLEYTRNGNRARFEERMFARRDRLHALVIAECLEDDGKYLDAIVDTAWAIAEESSWTVPAHQAPSRPRAAFRTRPSRSSTCSPRRPRTPSPGPGTCLVIGSTRCRRWCGRGSRARSTAAC